MYADGIGFSTYKADDIFLSAPPTPTKLQVASDPLQKRAVLVMNVMALPLHYLLPCPRPERHGIRIRSV